MDRTVYLDYNSTTPLDERVRRAVGDCLEHTWGNPSSIHSSGAAARAALDEAREKVAAALGAAVDEVVFTSGGTESNNAAVLGVMLAAPRGAKAVTSAVEHASVLEPFRFLERLGYEVAYVGVDRRGVVDIDALRRAVDDSTRLVSIMWVNNETGMVMPVAEAAEVAHARGALFHTDAVQALGKVEVDVDAAGADLLSVSAHKVYGPKGAGALFVRAGTVLEPLLHGGGQERGLRSGTENVAAAVGLGEAARLVSEEWREEASRVGGLREMLWEGIAGRIDGVSINGDLEGSVPNTLNLYVEGVSGEALVMSLDLEGIEISTGSACSEGNVEASHVLLAMGLGEEEARSSIRISLGKWTTEADVRRVLEVLPPVVERIRRAGGG